MNLNLKLNTNESTSDTKMTFNQSELSLLPGPRGLKQAEHHDCMFYHQGYLVKKLNSSTLAALQPLTQNKAVPPAVGIRLAESQFMISHRLQGTAHFLNK